MIARIGSFIAYIVVGLAGLGTAFFLSSQFAPRSHSQSDDMPTAESVRKELEMEMRQQTEQGNVVTEQDHGTAQSVPPPPPQAPAEDFISAPPSEMPANSQEALNVPPPPQMPPTAAQPSAASRGDSVPPATPPPSGNNVDADESLYGTLESILEPFIYSADNRRDPFDPYREVKQVSYDASIGPLLPLQRFDLDQIKLIGILWNVKNPKGMFLDPNNQVHFLGKDDRIGRSNGYIALIREGEVVVVETVTIRGELAHSARVLKLPR